MKRGFYTIMSAQFFSSLADNALFVAAVELLRTGGAPEWQRAALVPMFALFYVILAPFVGAFADALPKGRVMFFSNAIKVVGCLMMLFGHHPLMAYAVVGLGAAAYSPAKYGILTELLPASQLVKANGWIEGLTITSIILGVLLGGQLVGPVLSGYLLSLNLPGVQRMLVLNASSQGDSNDEVLNAFKADGCQQVILSKVDEAVKLGPSIDTLIRHQMQLCGVTNGQRVPEDWETADANQLVAASMRTSTRSAFDPKAIELDFFFTQSSLAGEMEPGHA